MNSNIFTSSRFQTELTEAGKAALTHITVTHMFKTMSPSEQNYHNLLEQSEIGKKKNICGNTVFQEPLRMTEVRKQTWNTRETSSTEGPFCCCPRFSEALPFFSIPPSSLTRWSIACCLPFTCQLWQLRQQPCLSVVAESNT